jgi:hypothetical protein
MLIVCFTVNAETRFRVELIDSRNGNNQEFVSGMIVAADSMFTIVTKSISSHRIARVQYYLDGKKIRIARRKPFALTANNRPWKLPAIGEHRLKVVVFSRLQKKAQSWRKKIRFTVRQSDGGSIITPTPTVIPSQTVIPTNTATPTPLTSGNAEFILVDTPVIIHDKDYYNFDEFINPLAPRNWFSPVDYSKGEMTIRVEVLSAPAGKFYYTVPIFKDDYREYLRPAVYVDSGKGVYEDTFPVVDMDYLLNGQLYSDVPTNFDWSRAFDSVNGDLVAYPGGGFPTRVKVKISVRLKNN